MRLVVAIALYIFVSANATGLPKSKRFDDFSVYKIKIENLNDRDTVNTLLNQPSNYNLWHTSTKEMHVMVNPKVLRTFKLIMRQKNISTQLLIPNVQVLIDAQENQYAEVI